MYNYLDEPNGSLKGGDPGIRLIEPTGMQQRSYFKVNPQMFEFQEGEWLIVPIYQIFGSEELSSVSSSISKRIQEPFLILNQMDAEKLDVQESDFIQVKVADVEFKVKVRIENSLQQGMAGLSVNLPGMPFIELPTYGKFQKI
jgi:NADH-quinone oxidoreductase subunit G